MRTHWEKPPRASVRSRPRMPEPFEGLTRVDALTLALLAILGLLQLLSYNRIERFGSDSSVYIVLAENLRSGVGYEFNGTPHTTYPPGFPVLLAGLGILFGTTRYDVLVRCMPVFSFLGLAAWYFVLRHAVGRNAAAVCCLLVATTSTLFGMNTVGVLSDSAYILGTGAALLCLTVLMERQRRTPPRDVLLVAGTILFTLASVMIRSVGIAVGAGMGVWAFSWILRRKKLRLPQITALASATFCVAVLLLWVGWTINVQQRLHDNNHMWTYASQFLTKDPHRPELGKATPMDLVLRAASNVPVQSAHIASLLTRLPYVAPLWYSPLVVCTLTLLCVGCVWQVREAASPVLVWYSVAYFGVYLLWPFDEGNRFMLPVAPLAFVFLWKGFCVARTRVQTITTRGALGVGTMSAVIGLVSLFSWPLPGLQAKASAAFWFVVAGSLALYALWGRRLQFDAGLGRRVASRLGWALVLLLFGAGIYQECALAHSNLNPNPATYTHHASEHFAMWVRTTAPSGSIMAEQAAIIYRISRRPIVHFPVTGDVEVLVGTIRRNGVRYLMVSDPVEYPYFFPTETERYEKIEASYPGLLQLVNRGPGYRVFEVRASATP